MPIEKSPPGILPSSILHLNSIKKDGSSPLFVFIPGNPGLIEFYEPFLLQIHNNNPDWEILGLSHAGMNSCDSVECPVYSLQEQIDHSVKVINRYSRVGRPLIIMGHSVGAYFTQKVALCNDLTGTVVRIGLLTPTLIDIHDSEKGRKLTRVTEWVPSFHKIVAGFSWLLFEKMLPTSLTSLLLSTTMGVDSRSDMALATKTLVTNSRFVKQALGLATEEMRVIRSDWEFQRTFLEFCRARNVKIWFLFSANDHWVSQQTRKDLIQFFEENGDSEMLEIDISPTLEHAFVRRHAEIVVREYFGHV
ncbi:LAFA_0D06876g1_1 [Lachancea sp. 'fantastica']|nr:LAFA_0D06876g1_1 [Lachancea sp. 'fantastica']